MHKSANHKPPSLAEMLASAWAECSDGTAPFEAAFEHRPYSFSSTRVLLSTVQTAFLASVVDAVERLVALPSYQRKALAAAPEIARFDPGSPGVFAGFDFHLGSRNAQLIEINTNAGGPFLNALLLKAWLAQDAAALRPAQDALPPGLEQGFFDMFLAEWQDQVGKRPLRSVAIVDDTPQAQFLYPEFLLCQQMFRRRGIDAVVADPGELIYRDGALWHGDGRIDLVYNRLTDFYLDAPQHRALREAYLARAVALTPHPRAHALYADKRNLIVLSDPAELRALGASDDVSAVLGAAVPATRLVQDVDAEALWAGRRGYFFKPTSGYGSKGAYRGDKLTRRVWQEILQGGYIAQALAPPSEQIVRVGEEDLGFKTDVRCYTYRGRIQLLAARLYRGQTTNFRTPGGGFAPVFVA